MTGRRAIAGLCMLCALVAGAFAAQGAAAATNGTTTFTCKKKAVEGGVGFSKEHCNSADAVGTGAKYEHVEVPEGKATEISVTNGGTGSGTETSTVARLKSVSSGVVLELQATGTAASGSGTNMKALAGPNIGEHTIEGTGTTTYSGVTVTAPAGKGCKVKGGSIVTNKLRGTSAEQGMEGKLQPNEGTVFATFTIEGCSVVALNKEYKIEGSIKCPGDGATVLCTHAATTAQGTLTMGGQKAGVEVATTFKGRASSAEAFTPLAVTTVGTP